MSYRDEIRADKAANREQDRADRREQLAGKLQVAEFQAEQKRQAEADRRKQEAADKKQKAAEKAAKKAARAAKNAKLRRWLKNNPATLFVAFVMVASIVPAVISQIGALQGASVNVGLAGLLAAMLEGGAWAITFMGKQAEDAGREPRKYRIATWATACAAAAVNFWHGLEQYAAHPWVAAVLGGSSLFAIYIWDLKTHGSHGPTRTQKRQEKARRKHAKDRRKDHKKVAEQADKLLSALPFGSLSEENAFIAAWRVAYGTDPGMTPEMYAEATKSKAALGAAFQLGEHVRPELIEAGIEAARMNPFKEIAQTPTTQAGIGLYTPKAGSETVSDETSRNTRAGRSEEELEELVPDALAAAAELVAEGAQISAAGLSKKLQIRREDAMRLRERVIAHRKQNAA
ncbi:DUF2637 domain-containing protein [Streptomyces sp. NBC_00063]|uniref:DUF2637 domain-containing protein n=1 Tax=Streptomyces sp. NBC_00063 TaxID=2975638 RepID=UPI003D71309C